MALKIFAAVCGMPAKQVCVCVSVFVYVCVCVCGMPGYADEMNPTNDPIAPNICLGSESEREREARGNCWRERKTDWVKCL